MSGDKPLCVMLIDDSIADRTLFREVLRTIDSTISFIQFESCEDAIEYFKSPLIKIPHYIFLDINMPKMDGIECLRELKKMSATKNIPILMYSTAPSEQYEETSLLLGAHKYVQKCTDFDECCAQVSELIGIEEKNQRNK